MRSKVINFVSILIILIYGFEAKAQDKKSVSGMVTTHKLIPLKKVKVIASKSGEVSFTDSVGWFHMQTFKKDILTVTASGFKTRKVKVGEQSNYKIDLLYEDNVTNFNDAVNNGHISETALKQAISEEQVKNGKDYSKYPSIYQLVASEFYDVTVRGNAIYNKKIRSFNANPQVLYVVDGKIVSDISFVTPTDVSKIEFIDDVGASMWGVLGANGVLSITLK